MAVTWFLVASHHRTQKAAQGQIHETFGPGGVVNIPVKAEEERARWYNLQKEKKKQGLSSKTGK
jgi:hypothetical protein